MIETAPTINVEPVSTPPFSHQAHEEIQRHAPAELREPLNIIITAIDQQGWEHMQPVASERDQKTLFPATHISVNELIRSLGIDIPSASTDVKRTMHVVFQGWVSPKVGGAPFTAWDMVYDVAQKYLPELTRAKSEGKPIPQIDILVPGSPHCLAGKVSKQWTRELDQTGFATHGQLYADWLKQEIDDRPTSKTTILLHGMSMGGPVAQETAHALKSLVDPNQVKIQTLLDNPAGIEHLTSPTPPKRHYPVVGVAVEGLIQLLRRNLKLEPIRLDREMNQSLQKKWLEKGIIKTDTPEQSTLKEKAASLEIQQMTKGIPLDENQRMFIRRGMMDPTSWSPEFYKRSRELLHKLIQIEHNHSTTETQANPVFGKEGTHTLEFPVQTTHFINRYRVKRWAKRLQQMQKRLQPS